MKKQIVKLLSTVVRSVANGSVERNSDWKFYQPPVPAKLRKGIKQE